MFRVCGRWQFSRCSPTSVGLAARRFRRRRRLLRDCRLLRHCESAANRRGDRHGVAGKILRGAAAPHRPSRGGRPGADRCRGFVPPLLPAVLALPFGPASSIHHLIEVPGRCSTRLRYRNAMVSPMRHVAILLLSWHTGCRVAAPVTSPRGAALRARPVPDDHRDRHSNREAPPGRLGACRYLLIPAPLCSPTPTPNAWSPPTGCRATWAGPGLAIVESDEDVLLYDTGHIPGAVKIDWHTDLNDPHVRTTSPASSSPS